MEINNYTTSELDQVAKQLVDEFGHFKVWCFEAEMGAGKTSLIKEICKQLGVGDEMSSPTFSIVNEYLTTEGKEVYHFDCYRLKDLDEAYDIGVEDYLFSGNVCLIEWPEIIEMLLPEQYLKININLVGDNTRSLTANPQ
jgi:tRNA threonylcarbamoyladenosine biosynthesis protein TsaE